MPPIPDSLDWAHDAGPISRHEANLPGLIGFTWPFYFFAVLAFGMSAIGFFVPSQEGPAVAMSIGAVCALIGVGMIAWGIVRMSSVIRGVRLLDEGLLWLDGGRWRGARWGEIVEVYRTEVKTNGSVTARDVRVVTDDGREATLHFCLSRWKQMADTIQTETLARQLPEAHARLADGEAVRFGAVSLSSEGLKVEKKLVPFEDIGGLSLVNGMLIVKVAGRRSDEKYVALSEIANSLVLLKLLEESEAPPLRLGR